ncbi:MAG: putative DNA binding domain-containing protein [Candidatus Solibacter usitatus]|nr:putative DNA binding domain-containing protein [Candidatus Solibacter usitatus]
MDLVTLLSRHEGKTLEFKRDLSSPEGVLKTIVAFANTSGGVMLLGVEDRTRKVKGLRDVLADEERLASLIADSISPKLVPSMEVMPWRKTQVLALEIYPSPNRPHYLNRLGPAEGVFVRVGSTNRRAGSFLIEEMRRYNQVSSFDEQPMPDLNSEAIDFRVASEFFKPIRKLTSQGLQSLKLTTGYQRRIVPTIGGVLLFGAARLKHFPDAWIQAGRFAGRDRRRILDSTEVRSYLPGAAEEVIAFLRKHMTREAVIGPVKRTGQWTFPVVAVREAIMNAIVHADYAQHGAPIRVALFDDRLEVENPGLLPFGLTIEDIRKGISKLRNRVIGRVFQELGLIEHWGSGIQRMTAACQERGLDAPQFEEIGTHFRVTLSARRRHTPAKNDRDQAILRALAASSEGGLSTSKIARRIGLSPRTARTRLASLVERGLVAEIGSGPQDPHRRYYLVSDAP